ncbi:MAG: SGNH hydrolase domain-containing protein, partial [Alphaproteobacteria bacterium]|nr:SGNH hydrolase domain-containing protein [Alphaproteobacteria bacterium]
ILQVASSGCKPSIDVLKPSEFSQCDQSNYFAVKTIKEAKPDVVVIAQGFDHSSEKMVVIAQYLRKIGVKRVLYLGSTPHWNSALPLIFARKLWIEKSKRIFTGLNLESVSTNERLIHELADENSFEFVNVINLFCNSSGCLTYTGEDVVQTLTTWDYGHLTISGSIYLAEHLLVPKIVRNFD